MEFDLIIRGGTVVTAADVGRSDIGVKDGRIAALADNLPRTASEIDASGLLVLPGGIDSHVHFDQPMGPGIVMADGFESGTRSAAAGGNTTVLSFALQPRGQIAAPERRGVPQEGEWPELRRLRLPPHRHRSDAGRAGPGAAGAGQLGLSVVQGVHDL